MPPGALWPLFLTGQMMKTSLAFQAHSPLAWTFCPSRSTLESSQASSACSFLSSLRLESHLLRWNILPSRLLIPVRIQPRSHALCETTLGYPITVAPFPYVTLFPFWPLFPLHSDQPWENKRGWRKINKEEAETTSSSLRRESYFLRLLFQASETLSVLPGTSLNQELKWRWCCKWVERDHLPPCFGIWAGHWQGALP